MEGKRIYISDIHMNAGRGFQAAKGKHPYEWLGSDEAKRFAVFLNAINDPNTVKEVIIIGDFLDDWVSHRYGAAFYRIDRKGPHQQGNRPDIEKIS